jgi:uncharacterized protein YoxC
MVLLLAQAITSDRPILYLIFAVVVAAGGCGAALIAHRGVKRDQEALRVARASLVSSEAWQGGYCQTEHELNEWLSRHSIDPTSGIGGIIRACWAAWWGGRAASTSEIHAFVGRRERHKVSPKLSAGIAALLLVVGIVGTLMSVHPILSDFQFRTSTAAGEDPGNDSAPLVNVAESTERVNALMNNLARAFYPSLAALFGTIAVVSFRGLYSHGLHQYIHDLDDFVTGALLPAYRPRSISEEYSEVRESFAQLAKNIAQREEKFDKVIAELSKFVDSVGPTLKGLDTGISRMTTAADNLAAKSNSIATTLTRTLGKKSPLYAAVNGFEGIFATTNDRLDKLSEHIEGIRSEQLEDRKSMLATLEEISRVTKQVSSDHEKDRDCVTKNIADLKTAIGKLPPDLLASARKTFEEGMTSMRTTLTESLDKQVADTAAAHEEVRSKTEETLKVISQSLTDTTTRINNSLKEIPAAVSRLDEALKEKSALEEAAASAIDSLANEAKAGIRSAAADAARKQPESTPSPAINLDPKPNGPQMPAYRPTPEPDDETPVTTESENEDRGRGFLGGFFGGRKS